MDSQSYQPLRSLPIDELELHQLQLPSSLNRARTSPITPSTRVPAESTARSPTSSPPDQDASVRVSGIDNALPSPVNHMQAEHRDGTPSRDPTVNITESPEHQLPDSLWNIWIYEFGACVLALVAVVALVATLYPQASKPLPQWPFRISINSLLAIYTTVLKAMVAYVMTSCIGQMQWSWLTLERPLHDAALYDGAGRGPWGSLQLLYTQRFRQPLAAVGAIITIMAVAVDPMVQGLVHPVDCSTEMKNEIASLPRTSAFHYKRNTYVTLDHEVLTRGIFYTGSTLSAECSTGNCTFWEGYSTLGYCSQCNDTTSQLRFDTTCPNRSQTCDYFHYADNVTASLPSGFGMTFWSPASAYDIEWTGQGTLEMCRMQARSDARRDLIQIEIIARKTRLQASGTGPIETSPFIFDGCQSSSVGANWTCHGYGAAICTLYPCIRTYNTTVAAGRLTETLIERSDPVAWGNYSRYRLGDSIISNPYVLYNLSLLDIQCLSKIEMDTLRATGYDIDGSTRWHFYSVPTPILWEYEDPGTFLPDTRLFEQLLGRGCLFTISTAFIDDLKAALELMDILKSPINISGNVIVQGSGPNLWVRDYEGSEALKQIYDVGRIDFPRVEEIFSNISEVITEFIRKNAVSNYSAPATGKVFHYATCLEVNWGWIAYPAAVVGLTILYCSSVVVFTTRQHLPTWKSSYLPWLLRGPSRDLWQVNGPVHGGMPITSRVMNEESKAIVLKLVDKKDPHLEIVQHHGSPSRVSTLPSENGDSNSTAPMT